MASSKVGYSVVQPAPGHGKPLNCWVPTPDTPNPPLPNALLIGNLSRSDEWADAGDDIEKAFLPVLTTREILMMQFMNSITDKESWRVQVLDNATVAKWRGETVLPNTQNTANLTVELFDFCIRELRHKARGIYKDPSTPIVVYNGNVLKADSSLSESAKLALQDAVKPLEDVPDREKDWAPDSDGVVRDLVDPNLFPLVYGRTKALKVGEKVVGIDDCVERSGTGEVLKMDDTPLDENESLMKPFSLEFQWLPCEVDVAGDRARIASYINNLHPKHTALYRAIEDVINSAVPLWQASLAPLFGDFGWAEPEFFRRIPRCTEVSHAEDGSLAQPEADQFNSRSLDAAMAKSVSFKELYGKDGKPLQVIVKLANIELTPEKPKYEGEPWHVQGMQNEYISATAMYCYSSSNVKSPQLAFRQLVDGSNFDEFEHEFGELEFLEEYFGFTEDGGCVQDVGMIEIREGRLIAFPNLLLLQVQPFELEDTTKAGHVKLLHLFLVDPKVRIVGTADVPAQRADWWRDAMGLGGRTDGQGWKKLPQEAKDMIFNALEDFPIPLEEAKGLRERSLKERKQYLLDHARAVKDCNSFRLE